ncbi:hypothetical protein EVAR_81287_1 [Eumeta japonica]|uniref:Uncharacterized protein n=1 Tax=Eumeta variegata TaxID=151549 RepID=A0A4C1W2F6_EUMVA|nr:hypothetical protein EVAR_81287_1 [Eumeta japonica]
MLVTPGKDITHKLYSVSEGLGVGGGDQREGMPSFLTRSASVDAVSEGTRGRLRSATWQTPTTRTQTGRGAAVPSAVSVRARAAGVGGGVRGGRGGRGAAPTVHAGVLCEPPAADSATESPAAGGVVPTRTRSQVRRAGAAGDHARVAGAGRVTRAAAPARAGAAGRATSAPRDLRARGRALTPRRANDNASHHRILI